MDAIGIATECHTIAYRGHRIDFSVVRRRRKTLEIVVEPDASVAVAAPMDAPIEAIAEKVRKWGAWVRRQQRFFGLEASLVRFPDPEAFRPKGLIVRRMEKRWGSLSPSGRLLLNRRLIEAPVDTIDYVIAHELCHMAEPHHAAAFYRLLDRVMPDWAGRKGRLEEWMA